MKRITLSYGAVLAAIAFGLQWLDYRLSARIIPTEIYVVCVALVFTALGVWAGNRLTRRAPSVPLDNNKNAPVRQHFGVSHREYQVLRLMAEGHTNKEIARALLVSPNTVKSHVAHLYDKLDVSRRAQAVHKAKSLQLIP